MMKSKSPSVSQGCFLPVKQKSSTFPRLASPLLTSGFSLSAFETSLAEGLKLEKKLFYSTFATVSKSLVQMETRSSAPEAPATSL